MRFAKDPPSAAFRPWTARSFLRSGATGLIPTIWMEIEEKLAKLYKANVDVTIALSKKGVLLEIKGDRSR
jgi:hypothetical protein